MRPKHLVGTVVVLCVVASWASAGEVRRLTLEQAHQLARERNPSVLANVQAIAAATAQRDEAQAARLPNLAFGARYARLSDVGDQTVTIPPVLPGMPAGGVQVPIARSIENSYGVTATVSAPVFSGFRLENRVKAADHLARATASDLDASRADIELAVDQLYWQLHSARAAERTIAESVRLVEAHRSDVGAMRSAGLTTDDDVLMVGVQLSETTLRHIQAQHAAQMAQAALCNALSLPLATEIALADSPQVIARTVPAQDSLERAAAEHRPELLAIAGRVAALDRQVTVALGGHLPVVAVQASYELSSPNQRYFPPDDKWRDSWNVGVGVSWTAWDWGIVRNQVARAHADYRQTEERARQLRDGVALQVMQSRLSVIEASRRIAVAQEGVRQAEEHYRMAKSRFSAGTASNTDVLDAEVALERTRLELIRALVDQQIAWSRLRHAVGDSAVGET